MSCSAAGLLCTALLVSPARAQSQERSLPLAFTVADTPSDDGSSLTLRWQADLEAPALQSLGLKPEATITIERRAFARSAASGAGGFIRAGRAPLSAGLFRDAALSPDSAYAYRLAVALPDSSQLFTALSTLARPRPNLFRAERFNALLLTLAMAALVIAFIMAAKRGASLYIRRIAGLDALDEAVGRATEMGRKILYVPGIISVNEIQTIASLGILGYVAKLTARYGTQLEVPNIDPLTMAAAREIVKQSYLEAGAPEAYHENMVPYITADQFAYTAAVNGIMVRDKPAANFLIGWFAAEALLLAETGQSVGAIQIAGTAQVTQLPFFVAACDYTMIGEELYAASAYLSRDPLILGSIKGQDMMKALLLALMIFGLAAVSFGWAGFAEWFTAR